MSESNVEPSSKVPDISTLPVAGSSTLATCWEAESNVVEPSRASVVVTSTSK